jgi:mRNA-degrading endonuclease RelE of RelBE toxin-antitoxin system
MYLDRYSEEITRKLAKLKKKDSKQYEIVRRKMDWILANPEHRYKDLHYDMKGINRVHIGHFVLTFTIDFVNKIISFEDYDHHDKIYK